MPPTDDVNLIDGFSSVQAVRHSGQKSGSARTRPSPSRLPRKNETKEPKASRGPKIGHTAVPVRREIVCYECGYAFVLQGHFPKTHCPKCHEVMDMADHVIDYEYAGTLKTMGTVDLGPHAVLKGATLIAGDVVIAGDARDADIRACRGVELREGATFEIERIHAEELRFAPGSRFVFTRKLECNNIDVAGTLRAKVHSRGVVTIRCGGLFRGELRGGHLVVEEGGGLCAKLLVKKTAPRTPRTKPTTRKK